jgi:PAS domain S-box-containing protein
MTQSRSALGTFVDRLLVALLLGGVGRLLVLNAPTLAEGALLRFDEAVSLFVAFTLGPWWGAVSALTATIWTDTPFPVAWVAEPVIVGATLQRLGGPVRTTMAYWIVLGALAAAGRLPTADLGAELPLLWPKQILNGALSASMARAAAAVPWLRRVFGDAPAPTLPLRLQFARAVGPLATIPIVLLGLGLGRMYVDDLEEAGTRDLEARADAVTVRLSDYVTGARGTVRTLAGALSEHRPRGDQLARTLSLHHAASNAFLTMMVTDESGRVTTATSRVSSLEPEAMSLSESTADRDYFQVPAVSGNPHVTDGFEGRVLGSDPIVAVSAPYTRADGSFGGVAQGSLDLRVFGQWLAQFVPESGASMLVLDRAGRVVASAGPDAAGLLSEGRNLPWIAATDQALTARVDDRSDGSGRHAAYVAVRRELAALGWQVHVRRPLRAMQAPIVPFYQLTAVWLVVCLVIASLLTNVAARRITQPLEALAGAAEAVGRGQVVPATVLPASAPAEVQSLKRELDAMVGRLDESLALLDRKVRERSAELAAAAAQHDTMFSAASDGLAVVDHDDRLVAVNDALCQLVGRDRETLLTLRMADLDLQDPRHTARNRLSSSGPSRFESAIRTATGAIVPVDVVVTAMPGGHGGRLLAAIRDISERRRADAERTQLEARLRQSQKMEAIGTLAGGIAHDFNNILTLIAGSVDLASMDVAEGHPARPFLDQIGRATTRAEALVRQILTFSRRRDEQREVVEVQPIVREAVGLLRSTLPAMIEIRAEVEDGLPRVQADGVQLHQVLMNLGGNAGHAMRTAGGVLTIAVRSERSTEPPPRAGVRIVVADTGTGMDRDTLDRVFEPFFTTKSAGEGTGLGLAMVHGIVTGHGGTIDVVSEPGLGTTFSIWLPTAALDTPASPVRGIPTAAPANPRASILVVDDEPELVGLVCRQLSRLGYTADGCGGPLEALTALADARRRYDLVMTDLAMPKMSGIELAERIRRDHATLPIVLCSGRVTDEDRDRAWRVGVADILAKPFAREQLAAVMARSLASVARH